MFVGHVIAHVFGVLPLMRTDQARTLVSIPKHDWCRLIFVVFDNTVNLRFEIYLEITSLFFLVEFNDELYEKLGKKDGSYISVGYLRIFQN